MKKTLRTQVFVPALSVLSMAVATAVQAQTAELEPVVVTAARFPQSLSEASVIVDVISRQTIEQSGASNITEFLDSVSGMTVSRLYGRAGVDASVDIGYLGEAGSQNVLILIDGQRINSIDSARSQFAQLPLSSIRQIEIRKANGGVLFGDRAQGGVINIITRTDGAKAVELGFGSFGYEKQDVYLGFNTSEMRGSLSLMNGKSDGYRAHSDSEQRSAQLRLATELGSGFASFFIRGFEENAKLPSYLTSVQFVQNPRQIGASPASSERVGGSTGLRYEQFFTNDDVLSIDAIYQVSSDKGYYSIKNSRSAINPEYATSIWGGRAIVGAEFFNAEANTDLGKQVGKKSQSVFTQFTHALTAHTDWDIGYRLQRAESNFKTTGDASASSTTSQKSGGSLGILSKLTKASTVRLGALAGFRFPNADELYSFGSGPPYALLEINPNIKPMSTREYFLQYDQRLQDLTLAAHYRQINSKDEIAYEFDCGNVGGVPASCNANLYDTKRSILSFSADWKINSTSLLKGSVDFVDATISSGLNEGRRIPLTPQQVVRVTYEHKIQDYMLTLAAHHRTNMIQASDPMGARSVIPSRTLVDLGVRTQLTQDISGSLWVRNAFNKTYYDYASYDGIYPADGRGIFVNLKVGF
jgi:iron complex outermembrane receptor protein